MNPSPLFARVLARLGLSLAILVGASSMLHAQCAGDCNGDGVVSINELITAVNIALGSRDIEDCRNADGNGDDAIAINELVRAVNSALSGCDSVDPTPTATPQLLATSTSTSTATATATATGPTRTPTEVQEPQITEFALLAADDSYIEPERTENGIPVYELPFGRFFRIIVEARAGGSRIPPGRDTFRQGAAPSFQIQASRPLGNGSAQVCDGDEPVPGGVPGIDPPSFETTDTVIDALNDFGCRFPDGAPSPSPAGRGCNTQEACLRFDDGTFGCQDPDSEVQYCSQLISEVEEFLEGDTLLSARVRETQVNGRVALISPVAQIIVRIIPPFPG